MKRWRTGLFCLLVGMSSLQVNALGASERDWSKYPMHEGPFDRSWESLATYEVPEWFRDAKFGIWAIIGPQAVPLQGDWYARHMYVEGHGQYRHHLDTYGHPSQHGYKDLVAAFNPTQLDYDDLLRRYQEAGARYAVILAVHHDNFDLWDSKHHAWNSVNQGPKRDLVREFKKAAEQHGLRFGVTTHLARSFSWLQTSHGADEEGPMAGVPYDGADPAYQDLYHVPSEESRHAPPHPPEQWEYDFYVRVKDLIDSYQPDLMYYDGPYPFGHDDGAVGRRLVAHYYNANSAWHEGDNQAAMCIKHTRPDTCVLDVERGKLAGLAEYPWQTDTCIGGWYYRESRGYKSVTHVVTMLIDIVSKNGNLLLNIPLHPDGFIDEDERAFLKNMGHWMDVNGEGIYETRPWLIFGEGPTRSRGGYFNEAPETFVPEDFRFTCKGDADLYAYFMAWPGDGTLVVRALGEGRSPEATISSVHLLGHHESLTWERTDEGLRVRLPKARPCEHAWGLRIRGRHLDRVDEEDLGLLDRVLLSPTNGTFTLLAKDARIRGKSPRLETKPGAAHANIGHWGDPGDSVSWALDVEAPGTYDITLCASSDHTSSEFTIEVGEQAIHVETRPTGSWSEFKIYPVGKVTLPAAGSVQLTVRPGKAWNSVGLQYLALDRTEE